MEGVLGVSLGSMLCRQASKDERQRVIVVCSIVSFYVHDQGEVGGGMPIFLLTRFPFRPLHEEVHAPDNGSRSGRVFVHSMNRLRGRHLLCFRCWELFVHIVARERTEMLFAPPSGRRKLFVRSLASFTIKRPWRLRKSQGTHIAIYIRTSLQSLSWRRRLRTACDRGHGHGHGDGIPMSAIVVLLICLSSFLVLIVELK